MKKMKTTVITETDKGWWENPRLEMRHWDHLCRAYNVGVKIYKQLPFEILSILYPNLPVIILDESGEIELSDFKHPENGLYIIGRSAQTLINTVKDAKYIYIDTSVKIPLFGLSVASIILEDRRRQWL